MKDNKNAWNDRGSKYERQSSATGLPLLTAVVAVDGNVSYHLTASESGKTDSQDIGENPP